MQVLWLDPSFILFLRFVSTIKTALHFSIQFDSNKCWESYFFFFVHFANVKNARVEFMNWFSNSNSRVNIKIHKEFFFVLRKLLKYSHNRSILCVLCSEEKWTLISRTSKNCEMVSHQTRHHTPLTCRRALVAIYSYTTYAFLGWKSSFKNFSFFASLWIVK